MNIFEQIRSFFSRYKNLRVIILCFLAATTFWFFNALNETYSASINYPITFEYDREEYIVMNELPEEVYLNLQGIGWNLFRNSLGIKVNPLRIYLENPSEIKSISGASLPALISDQLDEFQLNYVLTDSLYIDIDRKISRTFKVEVDSVEINLEENYLISTSIQYNPDSVLLVGPASILNALGDTILLNLPQNNIDEDYNEEVPITFSRDELIQKSPAAVNVVFGVEEILSTDAVVPIRAVNFPDDLILSDTLMDVILEVRASNFDQLNIEEIEVIADYRNFNATDSTVSPRLRFSPQYIHEIVIDTTNIPVERKPVPEQ